MYGSKLFTWGDNGAGQLGRCTSGNSNFVPGNVPGLVSFTSNSDKFYDEMQVYALNCGELYTMCAWHADDGRTHVYSFGKPNDEDLPREKSVFHKVQGLKAFRDPSICTDKNSAADLKASKDFEMRVWEKGKPMSKYRECFKFWPCGVDLYHDTVWDEWLFFRRQQVKEFKEGHDRDHNTIPLLSEAQIPRLFGFERSQHDNYTNYICRRSKRQTLT